MFANSSTLVFFPTFVWVYDLRPEDYRGINAGVLEKIEAYLPPPGRMAGGQALQTDTNLHELPEFAKLMAVAVEAGMRTLDFLEHERSPLKVTGCWASVGPPGAYHQEHTHPNNFLSGVYYVNVPEGGDTINFHDPRPQAHVIAPRVKSVSTKHAATVNVALAPGRLVLFPAWLRHSVDINTSRELRYSVAFNLMFESFAQDQSKPRFKGALGAKQAR